MKFVEQNVEGMPGLLYHSCQIVDNKVYLICGTTSPTYDSKFTNDVRVYDLSYRNWLHMTVKGDAPTPRALISSCVVDKKIYVFGGYDIEEHVYRCYNSVHILDTETNTWTEIKAKGVPPEARAGASLCYFRNEQKRKAGSGKLVMFGGCQGSKVVFDDLYTFDLDTHEWRIEIAQVADNKSPPPRWGHTAQIINGAMYIFGGMTKCGWASDRLWVLDFPGDSCEWRKDIQVSGRIPTARTGHASAVVGDSLVIVGGADIEGTKRSMYKFNTKKMRWAKMSGVKGRRKACTKMGMCAVYSKASNEILLFGGRDDFGDLSTTIYSASHLPITPSIASPTQLNKHVAITGTFDTLLTPDVPHSLSECPNMWRYEYTLEKNKDKKEANVLKRIFSFSKQKRTNAKDKEQGYAEEFETMLF